MGGFSSASATAIALVVLAGCCVLVRLLIRIAFVHHVGPDDYLITLAWAASMALAVVTGQRTYRTRYINLKPLAYLSSQRTITFRQPTNPKSSKFDWLLCFDSCGRQT